MDDGTQAPEAAPAVPPSTESGWTPSDIQRGLLMWLFIVTLGGVACVVLGHSEGGILFALAGGFALAQSTDAATAFQGYRDWVHRQFPPDTALGKAARLVVRAIVPVSGAAFYAGFTAWAAAAGNDRAHRFAAVWCAVAALFALSLTARRVADPITRFFFRRGEIGRTRRLTARMVALALLMPVPLRLIAPDLLESLKASGTAIADPGGLVAQLAGEIAVALAGVGWLVRRRSDETRVRLGLTGLAPWHLWVIVLGFAGAVVLNAGMEWTERSAFHALWQQDFDMTRLIAGKMPVWTSLLLGVSAGVGEEITIRGALQPRLGVVLSATLFACGHVQYTWFGMLTVGLLGVLLGTIRARTNTTTAILVHGLYDVFAAVTASGA